MTRAIRRFRRDDRGVTLVEYGIALVLAITVGVLGLDALATEVNGQADDARVTMQ